jgi:hypothetical protein
VCVREICAGARKQRKEKLGVHALNQRGSEKERAVRVLESEKLHVKLLCAAAQQQIREVKSESEACVRRASVGEREGAAKQQAGMLPACLLATREEGGRSPHYIRSSLHS